MTAEVVAAIGFVLILLVLLYCFYDINKQYLLFSEKNKIFTQLINDNLKEFQKELRRSYDEIDKLKKKG